MKVVEGNKLCDRGTDLWSYAETKNYGDVYVGASPSIIISSILLLSLNIFSALAK
jgi:hypothetical protein